MTAQQTQNGAVSFSTIQDKLAAIIYLLNTGSMTAQQLQTAASCFQCIQDKLGVIIYLLASGSGGGSGGSVQHGTGTPVSNRLAVAPPSLYINDSDSTLWAVSNGVWIMLV